MTDATGEILLRFGDSNELENRSKPGSIKSAVSNLMPSHRRIQFLALIITDKPEPVSSHLLTELKRGVTALQGKGMYTGNDRTILLCALTITEVHNLKAIVAREDPQAFVIVSASQEILGRGFSPLAVN